MVRILGLVRAKLFDRFSEFELERARGFDCTGRPGFGQKIFELECYSRTWLSISGAASLAIRLSW